MGQQLCAVRRADSNVQGNSSYQIDEMNSTTVAQTDVLVLHVMLLARRANIAPFGAGSAILEPVGRNKLLASS
jgi:hypothetical protein